MDITGREIWESYNNISQNQDEVTIPVSLFATGIYLLRVQTVSGTIVKKLRSREDDLYDQAVSSKEALFHRTPQRFLLTFRGWHKTLISNSVGSL